MLQRGSSRREHEHEHAHEHEHGWKILWKIIAARGIQVRVGAGAAGVAQLPPGAGALSEQPIELGTAAGMARGWPLETAGAGTPPLVGRRRRLLLEGSSGLLIYLAATAACLCLAWFVPGRGLETITLRVLVGTWLPGIAALALQPWLHRRGRAAAAVGLLLGMVLVGLALGGTAAGVAVAFRVFA